MNFMWQPVHRLEAVQLISPDILSMTNCLNVFFIEICHISALITFQMYKKGL